MIDCLDVTTQKAVKMSLKDWVKYFNSPSEERERILNVITLEIGETALGKLIRRPKVVRELDWVFEFLP